MGALLPWVSPALLMPSPPLNNPLSPNGLLTPLPGYICGKRDHTAWLSAANWLVQVDDSRTCSPHGRLGAGGSRKTGRVRPGWTPASCPLWRLLVSPTTASMLASESSFHRDRKEREKEGMEEWREGRSKRELCGQQRQRKEQTCNRLTTMHQTQVPCKVIGRKKTMQGKKKLMGAHHGWAPLLAWQHEQEQSYILG